MRKDATNYRESGVDIDAADSFIQQIKPLIRKTEGPEVLSSIGHYAGLFSLAGEKIRQPVLCASTDGVGTKLKLAIQLDRLEGLGQDLVAMSANDILCMGAKPLFFLDYFATGRLEPAQATRVLSGIVNACRKIRCALLGGETAEMPSLYQGGDFDLAGFIVGLVEKADIVDGRRIKEGDRVIGIASSGPHSNGFSLIRKIVSERGLSLDQVYSSLKKPLGETLLEPTRLYGPSVLPLLKGDSPKNKSIHGMAHITGSGFDNIPRILPAGLRAVIQRGSWRVPPLFHLLQEWGPVTPKEMERVFNMGIGFILVADPRRTASLVKRLKKSGEEVSIIGTIESCRKGEPSLWIKNN